MVSEVTKIAMLRDSCEKWFSLGNSLGSPKKEGKVVQRFGLILLTMLAFLLMEYVALD